MEQAHAYTDEDKANLRSPVMGTNITHTEEPKKISYESSMLAVRRIGQFMPHILSFFGSAELLSLVRFFELAPDAREVVSEIATEEQISAWIADEGAQLSSEQRVALNQFIQKVMCYDNNDLYDVPCEVRTELANLFTKVRKHSNGYHTRYF